MKEHLLKKLVVVAIGTSIFSGIAYAQQDVKVGSLPVVKNWTAPNYTMLSQSVVDEVFAKHSGQLLSITLQGVPPGFKDEIKSTMFAGTFPDRIGKMSSDIDVEVVKNGYMIIDPRLNKNDVPRKFTTLMPLRDKAGNHIGLAVIVFKNPVGTNKKEKDFVLAAYDIRDELAAKIPNHSAMFAPK